MAAPIDPVVHTAALAALEGALNQALTLAPEGRAELATLSGNVFAIQCTKPELHVYLQPTKRGIRLMGVHEGDVATSVRGEASDFAELASSPDPAATLINGKLELRGDSGALIQLQKILSNLDVDWEAPLVTTLGDVAGHQLAELLRGAFSWGKQATISLARQINEFIHEEARLSPPPLELEDYYRDVQDLVMRVERLTSRTQRLRKRLQTQKS